jgi:lysylphosphatidylglycerol synthetase-like protein (DUF2156 family)
MEFPALLLALCVLAVAGGAAALLTAHQARHRLGGLTVMAAGPVVGLVALGPHRTGAVVAATLSALTIAGLLLFARYLEGAGRRPELGHADLPLDEDPSRWP